ncbi:MAG: TonB family protein [bacterium]|nr:TonB family protein [bacterium]
MFRILFVFLLFSNALFAQSNRTIVAKIVDIESNEPIDSATVILMGSTKGATTNKLGYFQLDVPDSGKLFVVHPDYYENEIIIPPTNNFLIQLEELSYLPYNLVDQGAMPPGGGRGLFQILEDSLRYPENARLNNVEGDVRVSVIVDEYGRLIRPRVVSGLGYGCDEEAIRLINLCPNWIPAIKDGKPVNTGNEIYITFNLRKWKSKNHPNRIFMKTFLDNLEYPEGAKRAGVSTYVYTSFSIKNREASQLTIHNKTNVECNNAVKQAFNSLPKSAFSNLSEGVYSMPVKFQIDGSNLGRVSSPVENGIDIYYPTIVSYPNDSIQDIAYFYPTYFNSISEMNKVRPYSTVGNFANRGLNEVDPVVVRLTKLQKLDLAGNQIEELPLEFHKLWNLQQLFLSKNKLSSIGEQFPKRLNVLSLAFNKFDHIPHAIFENKGLTSLDLAGNQIEEIPSNISKLKNLQYLVLNDNPISDFPVEFTQLKNLRILYLFGTKVSSKTVQELRQQMPNLEILYN